ncbi:MULTISPECIES: SulP family inorganic anion transporter [Pseudomonas]|uniref:SulP family inorganic anion transporter n=1 Tax=Pseudomonas protegens TaxID=380021 RepID=A0A2T6GRW4_9PSED|nr:MULTISPECIES: SulP family inorganic anion transporter [Pseudomonas]PUA46886.1 SulP family inorganic anion transporter [Pseudomonas protegens]RXU59776.1 SulP family inorganic anion transporter [Pseudomonas protegens]ULT68240.1 STAS domain-containing protein [Pseudomonas sp. BC42]BAQ74333.1 SulP family inorganic anion transporter [Pseudomonas sp. Os17]BAQ80632.1 SulP family inorganic anion transporter [Pseudomonas sp. St29]
MSTDPGQLAATLAPRRSRDLLAGLSIAGLLLPEAVAYSSIAALPPQAGVIALFAGLLCYGLFGTSRFAIVSATSSSAAVLAAATLSLSDGDAQLRLSLGFALVLLTGAFFILAGLFRLGGVTAFIAKPVLRGFAFGLAVTIILKQFATVVGVHLSTGNLVRFLPQLLEQWPQWNWAGVAVAALALLVLAICSRIPYVPGGLVAVVIGIGAGQWLDLPSHGVALIGVIELKLEVPSLPDLPFADWLRLGELAFALVMILYAESYGSISALALKHGDRVSSNRDLLALGAANLVSGLFHGMPAGAGYSATSANEAAGARSRLAGLTAAAVMLLIVLTVLPYIALTPEPVLAAIVMYALGHGLSLQPLGRYFIWRRDRFLVICAVAAVLVLGVLDGLLLSVGVSILLMLRQLSAADIQILGQLGSGHDFVDLNRHPQARQVPGVLILRPGEALFFANAERILGGALRLIRQVQAPIHTVILSLEESPDLDGTSIEALDAFFRQVSLEHKHLALARLKHRAKDALAALPSSVGYQVLLSGTSVDDTLQESLQGWSGQAQAGLWH